MKRITHLLLATLIILITLSCRKSSDLFQADIIIYGGTSAAVISAVETEVPP